MFLQPLACLPCLLFICTTSCTFLAVCEHICCWAYIMGLPNGSHRPKVSDHCLNALRRWRTCSLQAHRRSASSTPQLSCSGQTRTCQWHQMQPPSSSISSSIQNPAHVRAPQNWQSPLGNSKAASVALSCCCFCTPASVAPFRAGTHFPNLLRRKLSHVLFHPTTFFQPLLLSILLYIAPMQST